MERAFGGKLAKYRDVSKDVLRWQEVYAGHSIDALSCGTLNPHARMSTFLKAQLGPELNFLHPPKYPILIHQHLNY